MRCVAELREASVDRLRAGRRGRHETGEAGRVRPHRALLTFI